MTIQVTVPLVFSQIAIMWFWLWSYRSTRNHARLNTTLYRRFHQRLNYTYAVLLLVSAMGYLPLNYWWQVIFTFLNGVVFYRFAHSSADGDEDFWNKLRNQTAAASLLCIATFVAPALSIHPPIITGIFAAFVFHRYRMVETVFYKGIFKDFQILQNKLQTNVAGKRNQRIISRSVS